METLLDTGLCTLPASDRPLRLAEFDELFSTAVLRVERRPDGRVRMRLSGGRGLLEHVRNLTERETGCCSFFTFTVTGSDQDLTLDIAVPPSGREILDALAARAEDLSG